MSETPIGDEVRRNFKFTTFVPAPNKYAPLSQEQLNKDYEEQAKLDEENYAKMIAKRKKTNGN